MISKKQHIATRAVQAGYDPGNAESRIPSIVQSTTYAFDSAEQIADVFDLDSDNDGVPDVVEVGLGNLSDGKAYLYSWVDTNLNGMHDSAESNIVPDFDGDGAPNYLDLDSDNDGVFDIVDVTSGVCRPRQALIKDKRFDGLYLLPAAQTKDKNAVTEEQMVKASKWFTFSWGIIAIGVACVANLAENLIQLVNFVCQ